MSSELLVALITAALMAAPGLILNMSQARKSHGDLAALYQEAAEKSERKRQRCEDELYQARDYAHCLEALAAELEQGIAILTNQVKGAGLTPLWRPLRRLADIRNTYEVNREAPAD